MLLIGYMFASILWSDMPYVSFKRCTRELIAAIMVFLVTTESEPRQALQSLFRRTIYILIPFSYILIHYFPQYGRQYGRWSGRLMWIGVGLQKNGLALLCLFSAFFLIWTLIRRSQGRDIPVVGYQTLIEILLLFLTIWLFMGPDHALTYSATSLVALLGGGVALIGLLCLKRLNVIIGASFLTVIVLIIIVYGTITPFIGKLSIVDVSSTLGRGETLTERTQIWAFLVPYAMEKATLGHGFGGFWTDVMRERSSSHAHNGYLDIILNLGFVGLILFSMFLLSCCRRFRKTLLHDFDWGAFGICFLLMAVVHNITESWVVGFTGSMAAVILFLAVSSSTTNSLAGKLQMKRNLSQHYMS
jgi:O-antigen ligase